MAPVASSLAGKWTLNYFPMPGAPGEVCRLLLSLSGADWEDARIPGKDWGALKPTTKFGSMPILKHQDGRVLAQSRAIARFLARAVPASTVGGDGTSSEHPLYPFDDKNPYLAFQIDEMVDQLEDARCLILPTFAIPDQSDKEAARAALFATDGTGKIVEAFRKAEQAAVAAGRSSPGCLVGTSVTLADCWAFAILNAFRAGFLDGIPTDGSWLAVLPKLKAVIENVAAIPAVKAYYEVQASKNPTYACFLPA